MKSKSRRYGAHITGLVAVLLAGLAAPVRAETVRDGLVLDQVTVVDVRTGRLRLHRAVVIADGKIKRIARAGSVRVSGNARLVSAGGRFLVPGFNDMHAHNLNTESPQTSLPLMLAYGVTGFRQMAGSPALLAARAKGADLLPKDSPALLAAPGLILAGPAFAEPSAVAAEVARQKAEGADFIKVVDLPHAAFLAAADAAAAHGLPLAGHLPLSVDARQAMAHHMASIEHLGPTVSLLLNCSRDEAAIRALLASAPPGAGGVDFSMEPARMRRMLANPVIMTPPQGFALIRRVLATYDEPKCRAFAADLAASQTWIVPTLTRLEAMNLGNTPALRDSPNLADVPAASRDLWREVGADFDRTLTEDQRKILADLFRRQQAMAGLLDQAGVKMLTGTDFGGQWIAPGVSLHHEFDLLAGAGVSPLRVLQMTTVDPARFLHRETTMGTVETGKNADLVLLQDDPTQAVANLHGVVAVVRAGRFHDRADLDAVRGRAEASLR